MTFDQLEYFMSCASCLNFSLAAKYHYVSVSTLSRNISALEEELGVKLFQRGYHGHSLTKEGLRFFDFAEATSRELLDFWLSIEKTKHNSDVLRIACYPFDNMFGRIVECFSQLPSDYLGKKYKVQFVAPGTMIDSVRRDRAHMGIATAAELEHCRDEFSTMVFFQSSFSLRADRGDAFAECDELSMERLLGMELRYSDFLPDKFLDEDTAEKELCSEEDVLKLGNITQMHLPEIVWEHQERMNGKYLLLPRVLELPPLKKKSVPIVGGNVFMEYLFFRKKNYNEFPSAKLHELSEYLSRNVNTY